MKNQSGALTDVSRIGKRTLRGNTVTLENRSGITTITLSPEGVERWRKTLAGYRQQRSAGNWQRGSGNRKSQRDRTDVRVTGLFATKRDGLFVGTAKGEQFDALIEKLKAAKQAGRGLTFFLWENTFKDGPPFSINVDVEQDQQQNAPAHRGYGARRKIEEDDEPTDDADNSDADNLFS